MSMIFGLKNGSFITTWRSLLHASTPRRSKAPVKGGLWLSAASARLILLPRRVQGICSAWCGCSAARKSVSTRLIGRGAGGSPVPESEPDHEGTGAGMSGNTPTLRPPARVAVLAGGLFFYRSR
jgi:hypothetical protein